MSLFSPRRANSRLDETTLAQARQLSLKRDNSRSSENPSVYLGFHPLRITQFRFHKLCLKDFSCRSLIARVWNTNVLGFPMFILRQKLKLLKKELRLRNSNIFGNIHLMVKKALEKVDSIQACISEVGHSLELLRQETKAQFDLLKAIDVEEAFGKEKARINWHSLRDRNTSFFHKVSKIRQATKSMSLLKVGGRINPNRTG
ncbi:hypothetical protein Lal_00000853 [Lupinus albus]|nr:hypothetical protein Lal_00000853 [Lupinus albus]